MGGVEREMGWGRGLGGLWGSRGRWGKPGGCREGAGLGRQPASPTGPCLGDTPPPVPPRGLVQGPPSSPPEQPYCLSHPHARKSRGYPNTLRHKCEYNARDSKFRNSQTEGAQQRQWHQGKFWKAPEGASVNRVGLNLHQLG